MVKLMNRQKEIPKATRLVKYLGSHWETPMRLEIVRDLRLGLLMG